MDLTKIKTYTIMNKTKRNDVLIAMIKCLVCGNQISDKAKNVFIA